MAFVTVKGTFEKFHNTGYGFTLVETYKAKDGTEYSKKWQVFPEDIQHGHVPSDIVTVTGMLTASVYEYTTDDGTTGNTVSMKVNNAKFIAPKTEPTAPAAANEMPF